MNKSKYLNKIKKSNKNIYELLYKQYNASNEEEFLAAILKDSETICCFVCHKEIEITKLSFRNGDPFCQDCLQGELYNYGCQ